jgi:hypothetical protein
MVLTSRPHYIYIRVNKMTSLDPNIWGPHFWTTLHYIASAYDDNPNPSVKMAMKTFIRSIPTLLPCKECPDHAFDYIKKANLDSAVSNRSQLFAFFVHFHNAVNIRLGKPTLSLQNAINMYSASSASSRHQGHRNYLILLFLAAILLFIFLKNF